MGDAQPPGPEVKQKGDAEGKGGAPQNLLIEHFFACKECGDAFRLKALLVQHQRIHSEQKGWECHDCGKVFRKVGDFNEHRQSHLPPQPPRPGPSQAPGPAPRPSSLRPAPRPAPRPEPPRPSPRPEPRKREHPPRETKPFKCEECGKRFKKNAGLSQHLRVHSREKPWACEECGRSFKTTQVRPELNPRLQGSDRPSELPGNPETRWWCWKEEGASQDGEGLSLRVTPA